MDEAYVLSAARYVELNSVRARLARRAQDYPWSSAAAHLAGPDHRLVQTGPLLPRVDDWAEFLADGRKASAAAALRRHERTGRPLGGEPFLAAMERRLGRTLAPQRRGPKPKLSKGN